MSQLLLLTNLASALNSQPRGVIDIVLVEEEQNVDVSSQFSATVGRGVFLVDPLTSLARVISCHKQSSTANEGRELLFFSSS